MSQDGSSSSSSSEDEDPVNNASAATEPLQTESRSTRFQCPVDFVSFSYKPCSSALSSSSSSSSSTELWLIKAPASFDPKSFRGVQLPLRGLETVSVPSADGMERPYSVLGSSDHRPELRLFAPPSSLAPPFSGLISISESHGDPSSDRALHVVPAVPPPSLPLGLKQRFQHFRAPAVCTARTEGEAMTRRKRKKEKKIKSEPQEASESAEVTPTELVIKTETKPEPLDTGFGEQPEVKKKKKKKKSKSAE